MAGAGLQATLDCLCQQSRGHTARPVGDGPSMAALCPTTAEPSSGARPRTPLPVRNTDCLHLCRKSVPGPPLTHSCSLPSSPSEAPETRRATRQGLGSRTQRVRSVEAKTFQPLSVSLVSLPKGLQSCTKSDMHLGTHKNPIGSEHLRLKIASCRKELL